MKEERSDFEEVDVEEFVSMERDDAVGKRLGKDGIEPVGVGGKDLSFCTVGLKGESSASLRTRSLLEAVVDRLNRRRVSRSVSSSSASA